MWLMFDSYKKRIDTCYSCDKLEDHKCTHCGCYMAAKAVLPFTKCPENKWNFQIETQKEKPEWFDILSK